VLGGMAAAWRRACVGITRHVHTWNWMLGNGAGSERSRPPGPGQLSNEDVIRFTPSWVSAKHLLALASLGLNVVVTLALFRWYVALAVGLSTYVLAELAGFLFPNRDHPYYVMQVHSTFSESLALAERFGDEARVGQIRSRLCELTRAYGPLLQLKGEEESPGAPSQDCAR